MNLNFQLLADEEEEGALPGLDLSDSDDDATWTPFKNKEERERPVGVPNVLNQGIDYLSFPPVK